MGRVRTTLGRLGGQAMALLAGSLAGLVVGAIAGFLLFAAGEALAGAFFGFEGFGDGPFIDMAPRSRLRGGFLILGAVAGLPLSWWVMRRMARADATRDDG
ncbi:MAG: hypothetical protein KQH83_01290 [Actinobacteria bacterium]|nr:hypothetical protein [Actinomycetota bacterium]